MATLEFAHCASPIEKRVRQDTVAGAGGNERMKKETGSSENMTEFSAPRITAM
jgi:hypothetical protein